LQRKVIEIMKSAVLTGLVYPTVQTSIERFEKDRRPQGNARVLSAAQETAHGRIVNPFA